MHSLFLEFLNLQGSDYNIQSDVSCCVILLSKIVSATIKLYQYKLNVILNAGDSPTIFSKFQGISRKLLPQHKAGSLIYNEMPLLGRSAAFAQSDLEISYCFL